MCVCVFCTSLLLQRVEAEACQIGTRQEDDGCQGESVLACLHPERKVHVCTPLRTYVQCVDNVDPGTVTPHNSL